MTGSNSPTYAGERLCDVSNLCRLGTCRDRDSHVRGKRRGHVNRTTIDRERLALYRDFCDAADFAQRGARANGVRVDGTRNLAEGDFDVVHSKLLIAFDRDCQHDIIVISTGSDSTPDIVSAEHP